MPILSTNNAHIYYELHGQGQPLVLISGYTCDHQIWIPILEKLSKKFQVLLFDNRGSGRTKDDGCALSAELLAQDVISLITHLELYKPNIVGSSMGGTIAQTVAALAPEKIQSVALLNTSAKWRRAMMLNIKTTLLMRKKAVDMDIILDVVSSTLFGETFLMNQQNIQMFKQSILSNPNPQSLEDQIRQIGVLENFDGRAQLRSIKSPTLVIAGVEDTISLPYESEFLANHIVNAKLTHLDCGHVSMFEDPNSLVEKLIEFF